MASRSEPVDSRADRVVQGTVAIVTLGAFVFRQSWLIPVLAVLVGVGAAVGPAANPFHRVFEGVVAPRLSAASSVVDAATIRAQDTLAAALLVGATLCLLIGLGGIAWIITLAEGGVAVVAATTGLHLGVVLRDRLRRQ